MNQVALTRCDDYDLAHVEQALRASFEMLGGIGRFVKPGQKVLLKVNLLRAMAPEAAATTHPAVVAMLAKLLSEAGAHPIVFDSPGGPFTAPMLRIIYNKTGMPLAEQYGAELNYDTESTQVSHPEGVLLHRLDVAQRVTDADVVINVPKLKTHNLTTLSGAVKNLFGTVPGILKLSYHAKMQDRNVFASGLLDILTYVKPALNVMDAVVAMEGNGPSGGDPRQVGAILMSEDAINLDIVAASLVGIDPLSVLTTFEAVKRGISTGKVQDIQVLGENLDALRILDFRKGMVATIDPGLMPKRLLEAVESSSNARGRNILRDLTQGWVAKQLIVTPRAGPGCTGCGNCARQCPVQAIRIVNGKAKMDTRVCIRCYCCHELCPQLAVELERPWLGRLIEGKAS